jgi:hypothetical protein
MTVAALSALVLFDVLLSGTRAAAGRDGRIAKPPHYRAAGLRALAAGVVVVVVLAANAALVGILVATAPQPAVAWASLLQAGVRCVEVCGAFATLTLIAILFWFAPVRELRIVPTLVVLGPLTLIRPFVVAGGLLYAVSGTASWRVWAAAVSAGVSMIGIEFVLGRAYCGRWRRLV